jgi:hypothetical protein
MMAFILHWTFLGAFSKGSFQELLPTNAPFENSILGGKDEPQLSLDWVHLDLPYILQPFIYPCKLVFSTFTYPTTFFQS